MMARRITSTILKLIGSTLLICGAAGYWIAGYANGAFEPVVSRRDSIVMLVAGALCWVAAIVVRGWPVTTPEIESPTSCPMCGEFLDPNAGICPKCFELRTPSNRL
jgi:hypothetical protein